MTDLEQSKYQVQPDPPFIDTSLNACAQNCEWRLSIYGRSLDEWDKLAKWIVDNKLFSHNVRWLIQVPRLYNVYKANGSINTFEDIVKSCVFLLIFLSVLNKSPCRCFSTLVRSDT